MKEKKKKKRRDPGISFKSSLSAAHWEVFLSGFDSEFKFLTRRQVSNLFLLQMKKKVMLFISNARIQDTHLLFFG